MSRVHKRWTHFRQHGLDTAQERVWGTLSPELIDALNRLKDTIIVSEVMEGPTIRVTFEVPANLDQAFQNALDP